MYESRPCAVIITLGNNSYRIPEVVLPPVISLTTAKQRSKIVSQTRKFIFLTTRSQGKKNIGAKTSKQGSPLRLRQMDKFMEEYEDIFSSLPEVPLHCQDKHSIDLTPNAPPPDVSIHPATTHTESKHVLSEADKETKFTKHIQHVHPQVHDIFNTSNTQFSRNFLISWRISTQWGPLLLKEGGMIQVDISGHPPIPFAPAPLILAAFHIQHNLLFLAGFRVLHSRSRFGALLI